MRRWLMMTTVDMDVRPNNREHNLLRHLAHHFDQVDVVFRRSFPPGSRVNGLRTALSYHSTVTRSGNISYVGVSPLFSHREGLLRDAIDISGESSGQSARLTMRRLAFNIIEPAAIAKDLSTILCLAAAARQQLRPDMDLVCTALGPWAAAAAYVLRRSGAIRHFIYEDRDYEPGFVGSTIRKAWVRTLENRMIKAADEVITIGQRLNDLRRRETGRELALIPTGVDWHAFSTNAHDRKPILVYTGRLESWSGVIPVIEALSAIASVVPDVRLRIIGTGSKPTIRRINEAASRTGSASRIEMMGALPHAEIAALIRECMVGLATFEPNELRTYAMPLKVLEYMAAGLPVLTTADTEAADVVSAHGCGLKLPLKPEAIAQAALTLLGNRDVWASMSARAVATSALFDWASLLDREWQVMRRSLILEPVK